MKKEPLSNERNLILAHILKKSREYVLAHLYPVTKTNYKKTGKNTKKNIGKNFGDGAEVKLTRTQEKRYEKLIGRRQNHEPMAYILGQKGFYGLDFKVTPDTLIPRPETELLVEKVLEKIQTNENQTPISIIDAGTGSGNIIISLARNSEQETVNRKSDLKLFGTDISAKALKISKHNAKKHNVHKKVKFIKSNLLDYFLDHCSLITGRCIIVANLPYLSKKIYSSAMPDVKNFEPKSALISGHDGLDHYAKLFSQIEALKEKLSIDQVSCYIEFSPEQKNKLSALAKRYFPKANVSFYKDLARKWRVCQIEMR